MTDLRTSEVGTIAADALRRAFGKESNNANAERATAKAPQTRRFGSSKASAPAGKTLDAVFVSDHTTKVTFSINSLAKAYNTIPELRDPQLEIGVTAKVEWIQVTPAEIPMY